MNKISPKSAQHPQKMIKKEEEFEREGFELNAWQ